VVEAFGHSGEHLEAERAPQADRADVALRHRVELHRAVAVRTGLVDGVLGEGAADALAFMARGHHEAGVGDVRARAALVAVRLRGTDDVARHVDRDEGPAGRVVQPARAGALLGGVAVPGERFPGGHDPADDGPDLWPVFLR